MRSNCAQARENRVADDRVKQPTSTENVGQRRDCERCEVAQANRREHRSEMCLGDSQPVLNLPERKAQQSSVVVLEKPGSGRNPEDAPLPLREGRQLFCDSGKACAMRLRILQIWSWPCKRSFTHERARKTREDSR